MKKTIFSMVLVLLMFLPGCGSNKQTIDWGYYIKENVLTIEGGDKIPSKYHKLCCLLYKTMGQHLEDMNALDGTFHQSWSYRSLGEIEGIVLMFEADDGRTYSVMTTMQ